MTPTLHTVPFQAMGCPNELRMYAGSKKEAEEASKAAIAEVRRIEEKYSRFRSDSTLSRINAAAGSGAGISVDDETAALLNYAAACFEQSAGLFDITSGVLRRAWNFKEKIVPSQQQLDELLPLIGWQKLRWRAPELHLPAGMELDLGGIGKEYAVDRACGVLLERKVTKALVNLGGDVRVLGSQEDSRPWSVGVAHPREEGQVAAVLELKSNALATSGDYERYFEAGGRRYCHILNPKTGWPATDFQSVSVVAESCLIAGTACTVAMLMGKKGGRGFLKTLGLTALVIEDGKAQRFN